MLDLEIGQWVSKKYDVQIRMDDSEAGLQCVPYHVRPNVHLAPEIVAHIDAGRLGAVHVGIMKARQWRRQLGDVVQQVARMTTESDEQKVLDAVPSQTGLVKVDGHVDEGRVDQGEDDVAVSRRTIGDRPDEGVVRGAAGRPGDNRRVEDLVDEVDG